jgi:hypothetical protein
LWSIWQGWTWTWILPISASQVARSTDVSQRQRASEGQRTRVRTRIFTYFGNEFKLSRPQSLVCITLTPLSCSWIISFRIQQYVAGIYFQMITWFMFTFLYLTVSSSRAGEVS